ncbi:hypothetical protein [Serratia nevei]|uniref:hypothetical protein n=1 Tax=Serratia nevei TaxID=2703794 RepID=UPI00286485F8|nr:hypothetical protein [Serratia nevei]MDR8481401.1 hypothetical protein [Serratia nevei]
MAKYLLRKLNINSLAVSYDTRKEFDRFSALRDEINTDKSLFFGKGFHVLDADNNIIFDHQAVQHLGANFTLKQAVFNYS